MYVILIHYTRSGKKKYLGIKKRKDKVRVLFIKTLILKKEKSSGKNLVFKFYLRSFGVVRSSSFYFITKTVLYRLEK